MNHSPLSPYLVGDKSSDLNHLRQALRELMQKICLLGLWRASFFEHASFYGGTALRLIHDLERWSEDLDFSLNTPNSNFDFEPYLNFVQKELEAWGITAAISLTEKEHSSICSAYIKCNTLECLKAAGIAPGKLKGLHRDEISSVKLEVDTLPPCGFDNESAFILEPIPFSVKVMDLSDLFAGKMHAILARSWQNRVKGRDWFDLIWFVRHKIVLKLSHLQARLKRSGHLGDEETLDGDLFKKLFELRVRTVNFEQAKSDVQPFIRDAKALDAWSEAFFLSFRDRIKTKSD